MATELGRQTARLVVADTGDGFDPAEADRLLERFYRTDPARTRGEAGSGIGLTITKEIIRRPRRKPSGPETSARATAPPSTSPATRRTLTVDVA